MSVFGQQDIFNGLLPVVNVQIHCHLEVNSLFFYLVSELLM